MFVKKISGFFLDVLFPDSRKITDLENMSSSEFMRKVRGAWQIEEINIEASASIDYKCSLAKDLIWAVKFRGNKKLARLCAELLDDILTDELSRLENFYGFTSPILIPMPLSKERLRERGYNQTELIADALLKIAPSKFILEKNVLKKLKNVVSQTSLKNRKERLKNQKGCFSIPFPEKVFGENIILLDDVITTGATMSEAAKVLYKAGAKKVIGLAVAH